MNWKNRSVLVTGGAGFIGSNLVEVLLRKGARVYVADLFPRSAGINLRSLPGAVRKIRCDLSEPSCRKKLPKSIDYIFHLAAMANPNECERDPVRAYACNVLTLLNVLIYAKEARPRRVVFPSSAYLYGDPKYLPVDEKHPLDYVKSIYNTTKKAGEDICDIFHKKFGIPVVYLRLFTTFGPKQSTTYFIPTVLVQSLKNPRIELWSDKPTRDFTYVSDTVAALMRAAGSRAFCDPINIGSGKELRTREIADYLAHLLGADVSFLGKKVIGPMRMCCDNRKAKRLLKWHPLISFEHGLVKTINWYKHLLKAGLL